MPNETLIENCLADLDGLTVSDPRIYWLSLARVAEMALKLAGDYADGCQFQAAGDLLVNPRQVDVYRRGGSTPLTKDRHVALSDQFAAAIGHELPAAWLARETVSAIRQDALLPHLKRQMTDSGMLADDYLASFSSRMCQVADTIAFLSAWQLDDISAYTRRMAEASPVDRQSMVDALCGFDHEIFDALGRDVRTLMLTPGADSRFLNDSYPVKTTVVA